MAWSWNVNYRLLMFSTVPPVDSDLVEFPNTSDYHIKAEKILHAESLTITANACRRPSLLLASAAPWLGSLT